MSRPLKLIVGVVAVFVLYLIAVPVVFLGTFGRYLEFIGSEPRGSLVGGAIICGGLLTLALVACRLSTSRWLKLLTVLVMLAAVLLFLAEVSLHFRH